MSRRSAKHGAVNVVDARSLSDIKWRVVEASTVRGRKLELTDSTWVVVADMRDMTKEQWETLFALELLKCLLALHDLVGLNDIKGEIAKMFNGVIASRFRGEEPQHRVPLFCFVGNSGSGKTEVAKIMGQLYWLLGSLRFGHTCCWIGSQMTANFEGQTASKVSWAMRQARGGVLLLDEAYSLWTNCVKLRGASCLQRALCWRRTPRKR
jgi:hypothetical protein